MLFKSSEEDMQAVHLLLGQSKHLFSSVHPPVNYVRQPLVHGPGCCEFLKNSLFFPNVAQEI